MILAGDIGGTNARLALFTPDAKRSLHQDALPTDAHANLESVVAVFLSSAPHGKITAATFGVAGPVIDGRCKMPNSPWVIDSRRLGRALGLTRVTLLNDLVALAYGALGVPRRKLVLLHGAALPKKKGQSVACIAAGTGLGEAALIWDGARHVPLATEGGHVDFAPRNRLEIELLEFLQARVGGRVSYERVLSGPGIGNLYEFFRDAVGVRESASARKEITAATDRNAAISRLGAAGTSKPAARAIDLFASIYGAEAGNLALKSFATGGVFVAGSIAAHLVPTLKRGAFVRSFLDKGRMSSLLRTVPLAVVLDSDIGLSGSARHAASLQGKTIRGES